MAEDLKAAAFTWWKQGFVVVPEIFVREPDGGIRKQPIIKWQKWENEDQTLEDFECLPWGAAEGFAVLCGKPNKSGLSVGVIDFDVKKTTVEAQALGRKALSFLRVTARESTPSGGEHWIYLCRTPPETNTAYHDVAALELCGKGHLAVMYPSKGYKRLNDNPPTAIDNLESMFLEALRKIGVVKDEKKPVSVEADSKPRLRPCFKKLLEKAELNHDERVALANELEHQGWSLEEVKRFFHEHKSWEPQYDAKKTDYQVESVFAHYGHFTRNELMERDRKSVV